MNSPNPIDHRASPATSRIVLGCRKSGSGLPGPAGWFLAFLIIFIVLLTPSFSDAAWSDSNWAYRKAITIDGTKIIGGPHDDFPVLISITDADLTASRADGFDLRFTLDDGETQLSHEIEKFDNTTGELVAWVKIPAPGLANGTDLTLFLYYGYAGALNQQNVNDVWSNGYLLVYHLHDDFVDSTGTSNATNYGSVDESPAQIADAQTFNGDDQHINTNWGSGASENNTVVTYSCWVKSSYMPNFDWDEGLIHKTQNGMMSWSHHNSSFHGSFSMNTPNGYVPASFNIQNPADLNRWLYLVGSYTDGTLKAYKDGILISTVSLDGTPVTNSDDILIGKHSQATATADRFFGGEIDEARVSTVVRDDDWIATEYNNQSDPGGFLLGVGAQEEPTECGPKQAYYRLDEGSGTTAVDSSANSFDGNLINGPTYTTGVSNTALDFSGVGEYVDVADPGDGSLDIEDGDFSVSLWFNTSELPADGFFPELVQKMEASTDGWEIFYWNNSGTSRIQFKIWKSTSDISVWADNIADGSWHHLVAVKDAANLHIYLDGAYVDSTSHTLGPVATTRPLQIGGRDGDSWADYNGLIDEVRIYKCALDSAQVAAIHAEEVPADVTAPSAVSDLATANPTATSIDLTWTAPGDDAGSGTAATYDIRYSTNPISDDTDFANAIPAAGEPAPQAAGSSESFTITGLSAATTYYFAIKTADEVPNWSTLSNSPAGTTDAGGWYDAWPYRKTINLDGSRFCETVGGFPVPITITGDADLQNYARADGFDILFTLDDGTSKIPHEIESFTQASGDLVAWVKLDIAAGVDQTLYMYYGNAGASDQQNKSGLWGAEYLGVWHLTDTQDATSNGHHGINAGAITWPNGQVAGAYDFDNPDFGAGGQDHIYIPDGGSLTTLGNTSNSNYTVSLWGRLDQLDDFRHFVSKMGTGSVFGGPTPFEIWFAPDGSPADRAAFSVKNGSADFHVESSVSLSADTWYHITAVREGDNLRLYINGVERGATSGAIGDTSCTQDITIGQRGDDTIYLDGKVDEFRIAQVVRSPAWIASEVCTAGGVVGTTDPPEGLAVTAAVAEITPNSVASGTSGNSFTYDILPSMGGGDTGVDRVVITAPGGYGIPGVTGVSVGGSVLAAGSSCPTASAGEYCVTIAGQDIAVTLGTKVTVDGTNIQVQFTADAPGSAGSADFTSTVDDTGTAAAAQATTMGDADGDAADNNSWTVNTDNGLIAHWPLDETSGTNADEVVANNDGSYNNDVALNQEGACGSTNSAIYFDGDSDGDEDYVHIPHHPSYLLDEGSVSLWFKADQLGSTIGLFSKDEPYGGTGGHLSITIENTEVRFRLQEADNTPHVVLGGSLVVDTWYHVVASWGSAGMKLFINGVQVGSNPYIGGTTADSGNLLPILLGAHNIFEGGLSGFLTGYLDDVRIYNRALNQIEVDDLFACATYSIGGTVFEDINYGGGSGRDYAAANTSAQVSGWADGEIGVENAVVELYENQAGSFIKVADTPASADGSYSFDGLSDGTYRVRVVSASVVSNRGSNATGLTPLAVQAFRNDPDSGGAVPGEVGGADPAAADAGAQSNGTDISTIPAQSVTEVVVSGADISAVDFGFNFDTIVNTHDSGQGSLRQFLVNSNELDNTNLDQEDNPAGTGFAVTKNAGEEHSIFMIPAAELVATIDAGPGTVMLIRPTSGALPDIQDAHTVVNGLTQSAVTGHTNGSTRIDEVTTGPEVIIDYQGNFATAGPDDIFAILADSVVIDAVGLTGTTGNQNHPVDIEAGVSNVIVRNTTIWNSGESSLKLQSGAFNNQILSNVMRDCGTDDGDSTADGIAFGGNNSGNTISGNHIIDAAGFGIDMVPVNPNDNNVITGNLIKGSGTSTSIQDAGIALRNGNNNIISGNTITGNAGEGILINSGSGGNQIIQNRIYANGALGIDLSALTNETGDGVTANDNPEGTDNGGNNLQNYPVLSSAAVSGSDATVAGSLNSAANTSYRIEFFTNAAADPSGSGEGETYKDFDIVTTDGSGDATISVVLSGVSGGQFITATATECLDGATCASLGNTSEFSAAVEATASGACGTKLVMVTGDGAFGTDYDNDKKLMFESWGFQVTAIDDNAGSTEFNDAADANNLIFISDSVDSGNLDNKARGLAIPIISEDTSTWESLMYSSSSGTASTTSETVNIVDDLHDITSPFDTGNLTIYSSSTLANFWVTLFGITLPPGAQVLGEGSGNPDRKWLITFESGAELEGIDNYAANRRVLIGTGGSNFDYWNDNLRTLMQRSVNWASCGVAYTPAVSSALAEISPNTVNIGTPGNSFTYDILPTIGASDSGVDQVVITAPAGYSKFSVTGVSVNGVGQAASDSCPTVGADEYCAAIVGQDITVTLGTPVTMDATSIQVQFSADAPLTDGSGDFTSTVDDTATATAAQSTVEGDANVDGGGDGNSWTVTVSGCGTYGLPFFDDFERADSFAVGNCWTEYESGGNVQIRDGKLFLEADDSAISPIVLHTFTPQASGHLRWSFEFDWDNDNTSEGRYEVWMQLGDSSQMVNSAGNHQGVGVNMLWGRNTTLTSHETLAYHSGGNDIPIAALFDLHFIEVIVDLDAHTYEILVDGSSWAAGVPFDNNVDIDAVRFYTHDLNGGRFLGETFDDVRVEVYTGESAVTSAVAEIAANDVAMFSLSNAFTYDIAFTIGVSDTGVDQVTITVPNTFGDPTVSDVLVGGVSLSGAYTDNTSGKLIDLVLDTPITTSDSIQVLFTADGPIAEDTVGQDFTATVDDTATPAPDQDAVEGDANGDGGADGNDWTVTATLHPLSIVKKAFTSNGTPIPDSATVPRGMAFKFLLYVNNPESARGDISLQDVLDAAFTYQAGTMKIDNTLGSCSAAACDAAEEAAIFAAAAAGAAVTDAADGDAASYNAGTIDVGNQVVGGNAAVDIAGGSAWALVFDVVMN